MPTHCSWDSILKRISYHFRVIYFCRARSDHFLILFQSTAPQIAVSPPLVGKGRRAAAGDGNPSGLPSLQGKVRPSKEAWWQQFKSNFPSSQSFQRWKALHFILTLTKQAGRGTEPRQDTALLLLGWIQPKRAQAWAQTWLLPGSALGMSQSLLQGLAFQGEKLKMGTSLSWRKREELPAVLRPARPGNTLCSQNPSLTVPASEDRHDCCWRRALPLPEMEEERDGPAPAARAPQATGWPLTVPTLPPPPARCRNESYVQNPC